MTNHIVTVTDCVDIAANELRGTLISTVGDADVSVEPFVPILPAFSAINGNLAMRLMADCYPDGTVLLSTLGPLKERPKAIIGRTLKKDLVFIGRNTGIFDWLTRDLGCAELYDVSAHYGEGKKFVSFAGRSVTAPLAAQAALGVPLSDLGTPLDESEIVRLDLADGTIAHIDNFGSMKFTGGLPSTEEGARYRVTVKGRSVEAVYAHRMIGLDTGTWSLFPGSSLGMFELGCVRHYGLPELGAEVGDVLEIELLG
ncbi:SAM-dependent chlorinase/fluorinase [Kitasatospora sp. NPDC085895]|uniref:SAM-dependent chlorinase/fluorinase n=1 Tax=Kitasatospora sp. NPDC085895 TaxID=3155057 RepID=UPI00344EB6C3